MLVNTRVPRPWQQQVNDDHRRRGPAYPNATVVNWYADSAAYPQYFYPDGVHLDPAGAKYYASLLAQALEAPSPVQRRPRRHPTTTTTAPRPRTWTGTSG